MTDKWVALNTFWNSFGLKAYDVYTVPDNAQMPYITYEASIGDLDEKIPLLASLWYYSTSWVDIDEKSESISNLIGSGMGVPYNGGRLWVTKGAPFAQRMDEPGSDFTRRIIMNIEVEFQ